MKNIINHLFRYIRVSSPSIASECVSPLKKYINESHLLRSKNLVRLGTAYGGWNIPVNIKLSSDSLCYLAGAGEDISFDCELVNRFGCNVRIIDPTPRAIEHFKNLECAIKEGRNFPINNSETEFYDLSSSDLSKITFLPIGLSDQNVELKFFMPKNPSHVSCSALNLQNTDDYFIAQCYRLGTVMERQGDKDIDLIKMDIEGSEYAVIKDMISSKLLPRILLVEFDEAHTPLDNNAGERIRDHINKLVQAGMRCVAVEGCNATFVRAW